MRAPNEEETMSRERTFLTVGLALACAIAVGCGSSDPDPSQSTTGTTSTSSATGGATDDPNAPLDPKTYCEKEQARAETCGEPTSPQSQQVCESNWTCLMARLRLDVLRQIQDCALERACSTSDDDCATAAAEALPDTAESTSYEAACKQKAMECDAFLSDICAGSKLYSDPMLEGSAACIAKPCDEVQPCLAALSAAASPACD
jgi:hypothetical protein